MNNIQIENAIKSKEIYEGSDKISKIIFNAYRKANAAGNDTLNFTDIIWDKEVAHVVERLEQFGITEFTLSSTYSGLLETVELFVENGCEMVGFTKVNDENIDFDGNRKMLPALSFKIKKGGK